MHPSVQAALTAEAAAELQVLGIVSVADVAFLWSSATEIFDCYADPSVVDSLTRAWQTARVLEDIRLEHLPALPAGSSAYQTTAVVGARPKTRCIPPASLMQKPFRVIFGMVKEISAAEKSGDDRTAVLDVMFHVARSAGSSNVLFGAELAQYPEKSQASFQRSLQPVPTEALHNHRRAFKRWTSYHTSHSPSDVPYWQPTALQLSAFLEHISQGGPTAAKAMFSSLKWWRQHIGVPLPVADGLVAHWSVADQKHCAEPKPPLDLDLFMRLVKVAPSFKGTLASAAAWTLLELGGCLRFAHMQRSHTLSIQGGLLRGICSKGNRGVGRVRPPFAWSAPARIGAFDLGEQILKDWREMRIKTPRLPLLYLTWYLARKTHCPLPLRDWSERCPLPSLRTCCKRSSQQSRLSFVGSHP